MVEYDAGTHTNLSTEEITSLEVVGDKQEKLWVGPEKVIVIQEPEKNNLLFELPNETPSSLSSVILEEQKRVERTLSAKNLTMPTLSSGETYANQGDWIFAKVDSDVFIGTK